jgi:hypothetical protein
MHARRTLPLIALAIVGFGCQPSGPNTSTPADLQANKLPPPPPATAGDAQATSDEEATIIDAYRAAHAGRDVEGMLKLYWLEGVSQETLEAVRENIGAELRYPIKAIKIEPTPPGQAAFREEGSIRWRDSLPPVAVLTVDFDISGAAPGELATSQVRLGAGRKGARLYLTATGRE